MQTCENYDLIGEAWRSLPSLSEGRRFFNPCEFNGVVYLCGFSVDNMEVFSPVTDTFLPIRISVPSLHGASCVLVETDLLVVYSEDKILRFSAGQDKQLILRSEKPASKTEKFQNSPPVVHKAHSLFYLVCGDKARGFQIETGVKVATVA